MSGVKHTPGPWVAKSGTTSYPECDDADSWVAVLSPAGKEVVTLYERYSLRPDDRGCWEADARLIAAAPEMFDYILSSAQNGCATAQQIIARARGEQDGGGE